MVFPSTVHKLLVCTSAKPPPPPILIPAQVGTLSPAIHSRIVLKLNAVTVLTAAPNLMRSPRSGDAARHGRQSDAELMTCPMSLLQLTTRL